jgi:hypothetical protein
MSAIASADIHDGMEKVNPLLGGHSNNPFCLHGNTALKGLGQKDRQRPSVGVQNPQGPGGKLLSRYYLIPAHLSTVMR